MARFFFGQIVAASIADGHGKTKVRPVVIIDGDRDYQITGELLVIVISSSQQTPCPDYHIQVHRGTKKDPATNLDRPSWAKCNLPRRVKISRIKHSIGDMPDDLLDEIIDAYHLILQNPKFPDWQ